MLEIAKIDVKPELATEFEANVAQSGPLFERAKGYRSMTLRRSVEAANRYWLIIGWDSVENHVVDFRESEDFQAWRSLVAHCFSAPPIVEHAEIVWQGSDAAKDASPG